MFKTKRRSFLKISFLAGLFLVFFKNFDLTAAEEKVSNKDLPIEANNWIVKMSQKEEVLSNTLKMRKIPFKQKLKNKILSFF